jgi:uncharacterized protein (UPF0303 family)
VLVGLRLMYQLEMTGETLESRKLDPKDLAAGGGGFPIVVKSSGPIGSICVSGMVNHLDDHRPIVDALTSHLIARRVFGLRGAGVGRFQEMLNDLR